LFQRVAGRIACGIENPLFRLSAGAEKTADAAAKSVNCRLHGKGKQLFESRKAKQLLVSISHTENYAAVTAVLDG
jgi:phosphopantetheinyl transferase (holo-ACP synthase)